MSPRRGGMKREPFVVPEWLAELAARDDPPTVIDGGLRGRLFSREIGGRDDDRESPGSIAAD